MTKAYKRTLIALALLTPIATFPLWAKVVWPQWFPDQVCILQAPNGDIIQGRDAECTGSGI
jgi:hypothetical protein